ncbi:alkylmercury lyase family protein [Streptomyces sp. NBC_00873]|uniref:organomercurial lyase n=1 Tax=unclassified Streptomyces TaxID=2593676 RepID=UPI00386D5032|nr:alkylmercury lyase family protein [Streptomyces sp. NBC_00873]WTA46723.1 alkylmercury lyase family protein [Streptomyces sp. NBC_00842]
MTVTFTSGSLLWEPVDAAVFIGRREGGGPAAEVCCDALNFFTGRDSAEQWRRGHPEVIGQVVSQDHAVQIGQQTFGPLLQND